MRISRSVAASLMMVLTLVCATAAGGEEVVTQGGVPKRLYLASHGKASAAGDDGALLWGPWMPETSDKFAGNEALTYTTEALERAVQATGEISMELYASANARTTNFSAIIEDVQPNGSVTRIDAAPAASSATLSMRKSNNVVLYSIDVGAIAHAFLPGHRIRVTISAPNSEAAGQRVLHGVSHPSALVLHVTD